MEGFFWGWAIVIGPLVLGLVIAYALFRRRRLAPTERRAQDEATRDQYRESERDR
jgi:cytochrome c-type biogenesis protein CcmH/NrfF